MKIAYCMATGPGDTNLLLAGVAARLQAAGLRTCGTVQINTEREECDGPCDMDVQVLPDGPVIRISQSLGSLSSGCRLNPDALERAVGEVGVRLDRGADVLLVNKFGKHEAEGRGFRELIAEALDRDMPVLCGLNTTNAPAFAAFTGGEATQLAPDAEVLFGWLLEHAATPADPA